MRLNFSSYVVSECFQKIDINDRGLFSLCDLRLFLPAYVQRSGVNWLPLISRTVLGQNLRDPCDIAPLNVNSF